MKTSKTTIVALILIGFLIGMSVPLVFLGFTTEKKKDSMYNIMYGYKLGWHEGLFYGWTSAPNLSYKFIFFRDSVLTARSLEERKRKNKN